MNVQAMFCPNVPQEKWANGDGNIASQSTQLNHPTKGHFCKSTQRPVHRRAGNLTGSTKNRSFISDHLEWQFFIMDTVTSVKEFPPPLSTLLSVEPWGKSNRLLIKRNGFGSNHNHLCPSGDGWSEKKHFTPQHNFRLLHLDFGIWILLQGGKIW